MGYFLMEKKFITAQELLEDSFRLANKIYLDGFRPNFIIGIWRGGAPIGIAVQEYFDYKEIKTDHIAVRTSSYNGINSQNKEVTVHGLHYIIENANADDNLLIVDDVFDSGKSIKALITNLQLSMRNNMPKELKVACPWYKPSNNQVDITPDYYVYESSQWLVFPHELSGLTKDEIINNKSDFSNIKALF